MKREILFRGLRTDGQGWVYGHYLNDNNHSMPHAIYDDGYFIEVKPESVSQFTGLLDKNGTRIFDGDVVVTTKFKDSPNVVKYVSHGFYRLKEIKGKQYLNILGSCEVMVIGNMHEQ